MNVNKVFIVGRVTVNPELRVTPSGQPVASLSVATNRVWKNKAGERQTEPEFHNVVLWGRNAEVASQFLSKGSLVFIEGRLRTRSWQDKQGANRRTTEIICERLQLGPKLSGSGSVAQDNLGKKKEAEEPGESNVDKEPPEPIEEIPTIDIAEENGAGSEINPEDLPF